MIEPSSSHASTRPEAQLDEAQPEALRELPADGARREAPPLVSWLVPTTLERHPWLERLEEFLLDDFPAGHAECVFLSTQDVGFATQAWQRARQRVEALAPGRPGVERRWRQVRFLEWHRPSFNLAVSRRLLTLRARGQVLIHRDADTGLLRQGFTRYAVTELVRHRVGLLGFPSLRNGQPFKPRTHWEAVREAPAPRPPGFRVTPSASVNGMATASLRSVELLLGRNRAAAAWGEHTALNAKLSRAGFLSAYAMDQGPWLSTHDHASDISLTDDRRNHNARRERTVFIALMNRFYAVTASDVFWQVQRSLYDVRVETLSPELQREVTARYALFAADQALPKARERFDFKPWACLHSARTGEFLSQYFEHAGPYFAPVERALQTVLPGEESEGWALAGGAG